MIEERERRGRERERVEKKIRALLSMCFITCRANEGERLRVNNCKAYPSFLPPLPSLLHATLTKNVYFCR